LEQYKEQSFLVAVVLCMHIMLFEIFLQPLG